MRQPYSQSPDGLGEILPHVLPGQGGHGDPRVSVMGCLVKPGAETWYVVGWQHGFPQSEYAHGHPTDYLVAGLITLIFLYLSHFSDFEESPLAKFPIPFIK